MALQGLRGLGSSAARRSGGLSAYGRTPEEAEASLLEKIGGVALGGLATVGNILDLPGSMVRDIIGGENPFDQLLSPTRSENRLSGRDVLEKRFGLRKNRETGFVPLADPGEFGRDVLGFGAEVLMDPLSFLTFGGAAASRSGQAARKAGLMPYLKKAGKGKLSAGGKRPMGVREAKTKLTVQDLIDASPDRAKSMQQLSDVMGSDAARDALLQQGERLGNTVGVGVPFMQPATGFNLGAAGGLYNRAADKLGMIAGKSAPVRTARALFDARVMGKPQAELQEVTPDLFRRQMEAEQRVLSDILPAADELERRGLADTDAAVRQRGFGEGVRLAADPNEERIVNMVKDSFKDVLSIDQSLGIKLGKELNDQIEYMARSLSREGGTGSRGAGPLSAADPAAVGREQEWKGFLRGTEHLNEVVQDADIDAFIKTNAGTHDKKQLVSGVRDIIEQKYGQDILPTFDVVNGKQVTAVDRYKRIAEKLVENPEIREQGMFNNHWLVDAKERLVSSVKRHEIAKTVYDVLAKEATPGSVLRLTADAPHRRTLKGLLQSLELDTKTAAAQILQRRGQQVTKQSIASILEESVSEDLGKGLTDLWPAFKAPPEISTPTKLFDSFTNLFKVGVLTWPARYTRDLLSGQARNIEAGLFDMRSAVDAHKILQGREVAGLSKMPAVSRFLQQQGINPAQATDRQASDALRQLYGSMKATRTNQMRDVAGVAEPGVRTIDELLGMVPGREKQTIPGAAVAVGRAIAGKAPDTNLNPLDIRGVMDKSGNIKSQTKFGPAVAGDMVGHYTDDMNRLVGFMHQIRKGVDPSTAMEKVNQAQVWYDPRAFTPTERQIKRLFPFYSFSSRQIPWMVQSLMEKPGGRLGALIKAQAATQRDRPPLPEHLAATGAIPVGKMEDGTQRFITGFGLMHEDPLSFVGGGAGGAVREVLSRLNPIPKTAIEGATGQSLFQAGPMGGRDLRDLDPIIGRILVNAGMIDETPSGQAPPVPSRTMEFLLANSPLSRTLSTVRTLTDPRKHKAVGAFPGDALALNLLTGVRVSDLSPGAQDAVIRDAASSVARDSGARAFESVYFSKEQIEKTREKDPERAKQMEAFNALRNHFARKARERTRDR